MKLSYVWLQELLPGLTQTPEEVAALLTKHSYETVIAEKRQIDPKVTVVKVEKVEPHPNADRLRLITFTDGKNSTKVVCGAFNFDVGDVVAWAPPGAQVHDADGKLFTLKETKIRGENSPGMIAALPELGLGEAPHKTIWVLPSNTMIGTPLQQHVPDDVIFEADITPNRAHDSLSHLGVARELAAILDLPVAEPELLITDVAAGDWQITNVDAQDVPRYLGGVFTGITPGISPLWIQARLLAVGIRPINALVDITNYVTAEVGQPTHAFDADKLPSHTMGARRAKADEKLATLDGKEHALSPEILVLTSNDEPVDIAGVMGGQTTKVDETTKNIFLSSAVFNPTTIQKSSAQLGLRTEASTRFSKGVPFGLPVKGLGRVAYLLQDILQARLEGIVGEDPLIQELVPFIAVNSERFSKIAGTAINLDEAQRLLTRLRFTVEVEEKNWQVAPPADRLDVKGEHDVVEEVVRMIGLDQIKAKAPATDQPVALPPDIQRLETIRDTLVSLGFTETYNYSFERTDIASKLEEADHQPKVELTNPLAPEQKYLRSSLLPGLLGNAIKNQLEFRRQYLFEIGTIFKATDGKVPGSAEERHLAILVTGEADSEHLLQATVTSLAETLEVPTDDLIKNSNVLDEAIQKKLKLRTPLAYIEINLDSLLAAVTKQPTYQFNLSQERPVFTPLSKYPPVFRDVSLLVSRDTGIETVQEVIERLGHDLVADVDLFDVYVPEDSSEDQQSLAFHIKYQAPDRTLTDDEVNTVHNAIISGLQAELSAVLR